MLQSTAGKAMGDGWNHLWGVGFGLAVACVAILAWRLRRVRDTAAATRTKLAETEAANAALADEIEQRKAIEEQKDRMFSIIAHDLRAPFSVLLGFASILNDESAELPREQIQRYSRSIHTNGVRVLALLDNMLQWARLQMKRVKVVLSTEPLRPIVERLIADLADGNGKEITLESHVDDVTVQADPALLSTTLRNLVTNGIKFTPSGGKVDVRAKAEGDSVVIEVADTGVGIAADRLPRLFEPGGQRATSGTHGETGTGLGLLICKDLLELHGSRLEVESTVGSGTVFRFALPIGEASPDGAAAKAGTAGGELGETV